MTIPAIPRWAAAAMVAALLIAGCGSDEPRPRDVSLDQLVLQEESYDGDLVRTAGTVASFGTGSGLHYWIEDESSNRVGLTPGRRAERLVGEEVVVVGTFRFDEGRGRQITVDQIERSDATAR